MSVSSAVLSFAPVAGLLTITPGLDTALVLRSTMVDGRRHGFVTALGIGTGALAWGAGAAVGISALLTASTVAYTGLRIIGAGYMTWLGCRMIWSVIGGTTASDPAGQVTKATSTWQSYRRGPLTNLLNPKIGAFYVAVLPQLIPDGTAHLAMGVLLALVHDLEGLLWFTLIISGAHGIRLWLRRVAVRRLIDALTGSVLVAFGLRLGLSTR